MRKWLGHHEEIMSDWLDWEEATKTEESEWRLEPEGEAEVPEIIIVLDAVEKHFRGPGWRKPPWSGRSKTLFQRDAPGEGGQEIKSHKRKVNRVESEETQDYVREAKSTEQEEMEDMSFVPSAVSVPQKLLFRCDNQ